jgi:hypothetical protein
MGFEATVEDVVPVLPAGIYPARFALIAEQSNDNGTFWLWTFVARNGNVDVEITATTSPRITPRTKAAKFLAGLGVLVTVGTHVQFEELYDTVCQLVVTINEQGYSRIESVLPYSNPTIAPTPIKGKAK